MEPAKFSPMSQILPSESAAFTSFGLYSPHGEGHHPWALLSGDDRIRQVSLALAGFSLSFFEGWYCRRGPLLGRQGEWCATWSPKAGDALNGPKT